MFDIVFSSILTVIFFTAVGAVFKKPEDVNFEYYSKLLIYGCIILSFISLLINFFSPLSKNLNSIIFFLSFFILFFKRKYFLKKEFFLFLILSCFILLLLLFGSHTYRPDAGLYHLPYTNILNEQKIIFGLSNLHYRFGHISIIQYLSAINNNLLYGINGIIFPSAIIACAVLINFSYRIIKYIRINELNFHFFYLIGVFAYICFKMNRYGEFGNDAPTHFLTFFLISEILNFRSKIKNDEFVLLLNLGVFIILNKITMFFVILLPFIFYEKINLKKIIKNLKTYFAICFGLLWLMKNILVSGCLIYPISFSCIESLEWTDIKKVKEVSLENEAFTKSWPNYAKRFENSQSYFVSDFNWFKTWIKKQTNQKEILLPYIFFLILIYGVIFFKSENLKIRIYKNYKILNLILISAFFLWFIKIPTYRYGYSIIISLLSITFANFCCKRKFLESVFLKNFFISILIFLISIFLIKNSLRIINTDFYTNYPFPRYYSHKDDNIKSKNYSVKVINGIKLYKENNGFCMYDKPLCSPYEINIRIEKYKGYMVFKNN